MVGWGELLGFHGKDHGLFHLPYKRDILGVITYNPCANHWSQLPQNIQVSTGLVETWGVLVMSTSPNWPPIHLTVWCGSNCTTSQHSSMGCLQPINQCIWLQVDGELPASWEVGKRFYLVVFLGIFWKTFPVTCKFRFFSECCLFVGRNLPVFRY